MELFILIIVVMLIGFFFNVIKKPKADNKEFLKPTGNYKSKYDSKFQDIEQPKPSIFQKQRHVDIPEVVKPTAEVVPRKSEPLSEADETEIEQILDNLISPADEAQELQQATWPYKRKPLLTFTEQRFFALLHEALPEHQIFVQVALNQMIKVDGKHNWANWYNRIAQMSVDFVISDNKGYVIAAIELDDKTHDNARGQSKDAKKDKALNSAGIAVLRYRCEAMPSINRVQKDVEKIYSLMPTK